MFLGAYMMLLYMYVHKCNSKILIRKGPTVLRESLCIGPHNFVQLYQMRAVIRISNRLSVVTWLDSASESKHCIVLLEGIQFLMSDTHEDLLSNCTSQCYDRSRKQ